MSLWLAPRPLIVASQSRTRQQLLADAAIPVRMIAPEIDERQIEAPLKAVGADAGSVARALARAKAGAVARAYPDDLVLGADQVLALGDRLFAKPSGRQQAAAQLQELSGRRHALFCAFCLRQGEEILADDVTVANLTMRPLCAGFIDRYLDAAGPTVFDCVGTYQLEGLGIHLFEHVEGDHSTILGLPLLPVLAALRKQGALAS